MVEGATAAMFNNIVYLIIVLVVFNIAPPAARVEASGTVAILFHLLGWVAFALCCRTGFGALVRDALRDGEGDRLAGRYQGLVMRLSILAVAIFSLDVHVLHLSYWLHQVPGAKALSVIPGMLAMAVFFWFLSTIWYFAYPAHVLAFGRTGDRRAFIAGNVRLNAPILFPWIGLTLLYDLVALTPWGGPGTFPGRTEGQMLLFAGFLILLMVFLPRLVQTWWGCSPFPRTEKIREIERFFREQGFRYRALLRWPLFEGRMLTAGIMGIVPRYRYILVTEGLLDLLSVEELKAVMAHEMGHARYRHLLFYVLFFLGFMVLSFGLLDLLPWLFAAHPAFAEAFQGGRPEADKLFYLSLAVLLLITMLVYFRFIMGFFMRNFERQADLFAGVTMGSTAPVARSLDRIALASGKIRDLPSWHHFSIRERIECLERAAADPGVVKRHNRFVGACFVLYVVGVLGLGWFLHFSGVKEDMAYRFMGKTLSRQLQETPNNALLYRNLALIHHELGELDEAVSAYERALALQPRSPEVLNNLAWILVTAPDKALRDERRALDLALMAVALQRSAPFLDTLAEAYFANGDPQQALRLIEEAVGEARDRKGYYLEQRERFRRALKERAESP